MDDKLIEELQELKGYLSENGEYADAEVIYKAISELRQCRDRMRWVDLPPEYVVDECCQYCHEDIQDDEDFLIGRDCVKGRLCLVHRKCHKEAQPPQQEQQEGES